MIQEVREGSAGELEESCEPLVVECTCIGVCKDRARRARANSTDRNDPEGSEAKVEGTPVVGQFTLVRDARPEGVGERLARGKHGCPNDGIRSLRLLCVGWPPPCVACVRVEPNHEPK